MQLPRAKATLQVHVKSTKAPCGVLQVGEGATHPSAVQADFELNRTTGAAGLQPLGPAADTSRNPGCKTLSANEDMHQVRKCPPATEPPGTWLSASSGRG